VTGAEAAGEAARRVALLGRRFAIGIRVVTLVPIASVAVLAADGPARTQAIVATLLTAAWSVFYVAGVVRGRTTLVTVVDGAVLCALGVVGAVVTPLHWLESGKSWIRPFVTFAAVGYQYSTRWTVGLPVGVAVCSTAVVATNVAQLGWVGLDATVTTVWSNVIAILARVLFTLLCSAAARADAAVADVAEARAAAVEGDARPFVHAKSSSFVPGASSRRAGPGSDCDA
jgi:hypothetical protein